MGKRFPEDTIVQFNYLPTLRAQLALGHNDARQAGVALQNATAYELGATLYPAYFRGVAYLAAHRGGEAVVEFQKVLDHRVPGPSLWPPETSMETENWILPCTTSRKVP